jgi:acetylornithine deacetylase
MLVKNDVKTDVIQLLKALIATPSFSREESATADQIEAFLSVQGLTSERKKNNIWVRSANWDSKRPTILLNSHHDTVKPVSTWTKDPFTPTIEDGKLYGLGSNDAGGCLISLMATFIHLQAETTNYNLIFAATAEEEISGKNGIASILDELGTIDFALVGEPTLMNIAIAEKGLMVIDATASGTAGHAARDEGDNAILHALTDIQWIQSYEFPEVSEWLGKVKCSVTQIQAGTQHNVVPDTCQFVIDVRTTDAYTNEAVFDILQANTQSQLKARSFRLQSSGIDTRHPIIQAGNAIGMECYGSPTLSDQALLPFPSIKIGPGDSRRSHTADEFIHLDEIGRGIDRYIELLTNLKLD